MLDHRAIPGTPAAPLLTATGLSKRYGGLVALADYDLSLSSGAIHGVIGPNGAGKTTLFNLLSRMVTATSGTIAFEGRDITDTPAHEVARLGISRTFQNIRLFGDLTALDNVTIGVQAHLPGSFLPHAPEPGLLPSSRSRDRGEGPRAAGAASVSPPWRCDRRAASRMGISGASRSRARSRSSRGS